MDSTLRRIDAHKWVQSLGLDYYHVAVLRQLHKDETLLVSAFAGPGCISGDLGLCAIEISKERGKGRYSFGASWTVNLTKKVRGHKFTSGVFLLQPRNVIEFPSELDESAAQAFREICRYAAWIFRRRSAYGVPPATVGEYMRNPALKLWRGVVIDSDGTTKTGIPAPDFETLTGLCSLTAPCLAAQP